MEHFDCELLNAVCSGDKECSLQMRELFKCKSCESSIHEKHRCHNLQENILTFLNSQLAQSKGVRALDCFCVIKDTTTGCRMKKKLTNNFYDCHVTSTPNENQCKNLYQKCSKNGFSSVCGQSLLKLMSNCSVPTNGSCDENNCIHSIGDLIFYDFNHAEAATFYKCCEYEHKCNGLPWTIYSPKTCLQRSPLYSCTYSYEGCLEDPECYQNVKTIEEKCHEDFLHHNKTYCDKNWYNLDSQDVQDCIAATRALERFYCSCELNKSLPYEEAIKELDECLKYRRLFTVQPCVEQEMRGLSMDKPRTETIQPVSYIIFITLLGISCLICICCCFAKPSIFKQTRQSSLRRSRLQLPENVPMRPNSRNSSASLVTRRNESSDSFTSRLSPRYETISIWERLMKHTKAYCILKSKKLRRRFEYSSPEMMPKSQLKSLDSKDDNMLTLQIEQK